MGFARKVVALAPLDDAAEKEIARLDALLRARREVQHVKNQLRLHAERTERVRSLLREKLAAAESHLATVLGAGEAAA
jgi:hypothetical protein